MKHHGLVICVVSATVLLGRSWLCIILVDNIVITM
jgi:hypothetical protein